ncbi:MAG: PEP-CTERM sorting domain-containing protein [Akkermansiaceae bacterium]
MFAAAMSVATSAQAASVSVGDSSASWLGYMNVSNLPADGGAFQFGQTWGVSDLNVSFDDAAEAITFTPNSVADPNEYWYKGGRPGEDPGNPNDNGGSGAPGNKNMQANLYIEVNDNSLAGQTVDFTGTIDSYSLTGAHTFQVFIRDFAPDYSSSFDTFVPVSASGAFSASITTDPGAGRHIQYGFQMTGENVWSTDLAPFGSVVISSAAVPEPSSALLGLLGLAFIARRRR